MLAPEKMLSATRQNLWRLTFVRTLVLAAQAGSVGVAYWTELLPLPWLALSITLGFSMVLCLVTALRLRASLPSIQYVLGKGASLVLMSHLGRPDGQAIARALRSLALPQRFGLAMEIRRHADDFKAAVRPPTQLATVSSAW